MDRNRLIVLRKDNWSRAVFQGARLSMSMIMTHLRSKRGLCPQPGCTGVAEAVPGVSGCLTWYVSPLRKAQARLTTVL